MTVEQISTGGTVTYLHHDQQGSTRLLTGSTGTVTGKCTYGAYGMPTCEGTATTPLGYDGQYTNSDTGLIYLRARTYDPATAQFVTVDPIAPITRAPYSYADDNPLNDSDPSGRGGFWETTVHPVLGVAGVGDTFGHGDHNCDRDANLLCRRQRRARDWAGCRLSCVCGLCRRRRCFHCI